jgi:hypothetical protein
MRIAQRNEFQHSTSVFAVRLAVIQEFSEASKALFRRGAIKCQTMILSRFNAFVNSNLVAGAGAKISACSPMASRLMSEY